MSALHWAIGIAAGGAAIYLYRQWLYMQSLPQSGSDPIESVIDLSSEYVPHTFTAYPRGPQLNPDPDDVEGLARALASEAGSTRYTTEERTAIAMTAINWCNRIKRDMSSIMLPPHHQKGHWCSTFNDPTDSDIALAYECLNGEHGDPTSGATSFFEPAQEKPGIAGSTRTADQLRQKWQSDGLKLYAAIGQWEFWGRA